MSDWLFGWLLLWLLLGALVLLVIGTFFIIRSDEREHGAFIAECMADGRKRYECEALYGQANSPSVTPVIIHH